MAPYFSAAFVALLLFGADAAHIRPRSPEANPNLVPKYASFPRHVKRQAFLNQTTTTRPPQITTLPDVIPIPIVGGGADEATTTTTVTRDRNGGLPDDVPIPQAGESFSLSTGPNGQETIVTLPPNNPPAASASASASDDDTPASSTATPGAALPVPIIGGSKSLPVDVPPVATPIVSKVTDAEGDVTSIVAPVATPIISRVTDAQGDVSSIVAPVVTPVVSKVTNAVGDVSSVVVAPVVTPVVSKVTNAVGDVSSVVVAPVVTPIVSEVTDAAGVVSSVVVAPVVTPVVSEVTNAAGVVSSAVAAPIVTPAVSVVSNAAGDLSTVVDPIVTPAVSVVTNAAGEVSTAVAPVVSAVSNAAGEVTSLTIPPVVVGSQSLAPSVVGSIIQSVLSEASVPTGPLPTEVVNSILSQISASVPPAGSQLTSLISVPPVATTLPDGVVTTLPGTSVPTVIPLVGSVSSQTGTGMSETVPGAVVSQSAGSTLPVSAATASVTGASGATATESGSQATPASDSAQLSASVASAASGASGSETASATATENPEAIAPLLFSPSGATSIAPTGTDSLTALYTNSVIVADQPSTTAPLATSQYGIPTTLPQVIAPPNSGGRLPAQPPNTEMIQIAFLRPLNYPFVISHIPAIEQIYNYLPVGIAYGLGIDQPNVTMHSLQPYDTTATQGFITTVAYAYVPQDMVDMMALQVSNPAARFHHYPPESSQVFQLIKYVNTAFPVRAPASVNGGPGSAAPGGPNPTPSTVLNVVDPLNNGSGSSSTVNPTSIGIGFAVVGGAALYGAAMFFVARRYKKRRSVHGRSPSIIDTASMSQTPGEMVTGAGAALMSGGRGLSGDHDTAYYGAGGYGGNSGRNSRGSGRSGSSRGRDISAPVTAENSLGWN